MLEHLKAQIGDKDTKDMTADELQFYYFNYGSKNSDSQSEIDHYLVSYRIFVYILDAKVFANVFSTAKWLYINNCFRKIVVLSTLQGYNQLLTRNLVLMSIMILENLDMN